MRLLKYLLLLLLASCGMQESTHDLNAVAHQKQTITNGLQTYVKGQLLLVFSPSVTEQQARQRISHLGGSVIRFVLQQRFYQVQVPKGVRAQDEIVKYQQMQGIQSVGLNYKRMMR